MSDTIAVETIVVGTIAVGTIESDKFGSHMEIAFKKLSEQEHAVRVFRADGSEESAILNSRSFLRHDLAHLAVETQLSLARGYWGSVASGAALNGMDIRGSDILLAEKLAGAVQTLMRIEASDAQFFSTLARIHPGLITPELASRIREHGRKLQGHWRGTPFGEEMRVGWSEPLTAKDVRRQS